MNNPIKMILKGAIIVLIGSIIGKIFNLTYRILLSRLGQDAYGEFSLGLALFGILSVISILGLDTGVLRYISVYKSENSPEKIKGILFFATRTIFVLNLVLGILLFIFSDLIATKLFHTPNLGILLKVFAFGLPFESLRTIITNTFQAFKKIEYDVISRIIIENTLKILLTIIFLKLGLGVVSATIAYVISLGISFFVSIFLLTTKLFNLFDNKIHPLYNNQEIFYYSLPLVFNSLTLILITWTDTIMLGYFLTTSIVGIYNVAVPTGRLIIIFPKAFEALYLPNIASVFENKDELRRIYYTITKWVVLVTSMALFWLIFFSREIIIFFFKEEYLAATTPLIILLIGYFLQGLSYTSRNILLLVKKTKTIFWATISSSITNIVLNLLFIPKYGMIGAAVSSTISLVLMALIFFIVSYKETKINPFNLKTILIVVISLFSVIITKQLLTYVALIQLYLLLPISILLIVIFTFIFLVITNTLESDDKDMINLILKKLNIKKNG